MAAEARDRGDDRLGRVAEAEEQRIGGGRGGV